VADTRSTEKLLELIAEHASEISPPDDAQSSHARAIVEAVNELRRRGDTLVRREDIWTVLEYASSDEVFLETQRTELKAAFARIEKVLGPPP
jgi:hypothetical protein